MSAPRSARQPRKPTNGRPIGMAKGATAPTTQPDSPAAPPPAEGTAPSGPSPIDARVAGLASIDPNEAISMMQAKIGELEMQKLLDSRAIVRLVAHIKALDPDDSLARAIEAERSKQEAT